MNYTIVDSALNKIDSTFVSDIVDGKKQLSIFVKKAPRAQFANVTCTASDDLT